MRYIVTGGMGFIGSHFVHYLLERDRESSVVNLDAMTYAANPQTLERFEDEPRHRFVKCDICDASAVQRVMHEMEAEGGVDLVVHFAAETHVDRAIADAAPFVRTNVEGTNVLLAAARRYGVSKFILISTDEVYGTIPVGEAAVETAALCPRNPYAATKVGAEMLAYSYYVTHDLPVVITRAANTYGAYQYPEKMIPRFVTRLLAGNDVPVYGDGRQIRDWLHVTDHCRAIDLICREGALGERYNIAGGNHRTNLAVTQAILTRLGMSEERITFVTDRPGHDRRYAIDDAKLRALGWEPVVPFDEGLAETVEWYRKHRDWWAR